jgi:hypothetical protein
MHDLKNMKPRNMGNNFVKKMKILHDYRKLFHIDFRNNFAHFSTLTTARSPLRFKKRTQF